MSRTFLRNGASWKRWGCVILIAAVSIASADDLQPVSPGQSAVVPTDKPAEPPPTQSKMDHKYWLASVVLSPLDWWIPGKYGVMFAYMPNNSQVFEFEYLRGTFGSGLLEHDLGEPLEQRFTVQSRYFVTDTFNYHAGVHYNFFEVKLKDKYVSNVSASSAKVATVGMTLGIGHRWQLDNGMEIGVDWLEFQMPFIRVKQDSPSQDEVEEVIRRMRDNPRFALLKFQVGISF